MPTTIEAQSAVKAAFKKKGWSSRQVAVRRKFFSGGSELSIEIRDPSVPICVVKEIAEAGKSIRRCEVTGEILSGGNRYVHVRYRDDVLEAMAKTYVSAVAAAVAKIEPGSNSLVEVEDTPFSVGRPNAESDKTVTLWGERFIAQCWGAEGAAEIVAPLMAALAAGVEIDK